MTTSRERFQVLLKRLFQFDSDELDFGIYRIMNQKRVGALKQFIEKDLLEGVTAVLSSGALAREAEAARRLSEICTQIRESFGDDALDANGHLAVPYLNTPLGRKFSQLNQEIGKARSHSELEVAIFNYLYAFFSRYYDDGDFLSLRRYSQFEKYVIPYNGEEVHFHWANNDQYYIRTADTFTDYAYKHGNWSVRFQLRKASAEQTGARGAKRLFLPRLEEVALDEKATSLTVPFDFRPLTVEEISRYGGKKAQDHSSSRGDGQNRSAIRAPNQEAILAHAVDAIVAVAKTNTVALAAVMSRKRTAADGESVSLLEHHLRIYTRRNTSDFFIHKDLKRFLERELDFYLKNEVLSLDDLEGTTRQRSDGWFETFLAVRNIGSRIIDFLAQIEELQKTLFEKKKFVRKVHYCVTLDRIPPSLYADILTNASQIAEWKQLFKLDESKAADAMSENFLKENQDLVIDTQHFSSDFTDALLESVELLGGKPSLDDAIDGILIEGDNFQALRLLQRRFTGQVKCMYVDPPYNRGGDFIYKDSYRHSTWLSMIFDRLGVAHPLLSDKGVVFTSIDENEHTHLDEVLTRIFGEENRIEDLIWVQNTTHSQSPTYSTNHEYILTYAKDKLATIADGSMFREPKPGFDEMQRLIKGLNPRFPGIVEIEGQIATLTQQHLEQYKQELKQIDLEYNDDTKKQDPWRGIYPYSRAEYRNAQSRWVPESEAKETNASIWVWRESDPSAPAGKQSETTKDPKHPNYRFYRPLHPITKKPCPCPKRGWKFPYKWEDSSRESFVEYDREDRIVWGEDETKIPQYKTFLHKVETNVAKSVIHDYTDGEKQVAALFGATDVFPNPKPSTLIERLIVQTCRGNEWILDPFAGSGTSGQSAMEAAISLKARLRFILIEMGKHFEEILLPRIKKLCYTPYWQNGNPNGHATADELRYGAHVLKCIHLESYEDSLNSIVFQNDATQTSLPFQEYVTKYLLQLGTKNSTTFLDIRGLDAPFDYTLWQHGGHPSLPLDLPETFNFLIGLHVSSRRVLKNKGSRYLIYRGRAGDLETVVLWRATAGWTAKEFDADRQFVEEKRLTEGAQDILVNSDSFIPKARSLDPIFKRLMFS